MVKMTRRMVLGSVFGLVQLHTGFLISGRKYVGTHIDLLEPKHVVEDGRTGYGSQRTGYGGVGCPLFISNYF